MSCSVIDFRCIFVNEIVGSIVLAVLLAVIIYLIAASKLRLGFDTTIFFAVPIAIILSLAIGGFTAVYAFATILVALLVAYVFNKVIGNR